MRGSDLCPAWSPLNPRREAVKMPEHESAGRTPFPEDGRDKLGWGCPGDPSVGSSTSFLSSLILIILCSHWTSYQLLSRSVILAILTALINSLNHFNIFINVFSKFFSESDFFKK